MRVAKFSIQSSLEERGPEVLSSAVVVERINERVANELDRIEVEVVSRIVANLKLSAEAFGVAD